MSKKTMQAAKERQQAQPGGVVITKRPAKKPIPTKK